MILLQVIEVAAIIFCENELTHEGSDGCFAVTLRGSEGPDLVVSVCLGLSGGRVGEFRALFDQS
jgi:hypothetical protein